MSRLKTPDVITSGCDDDMPQTGSMPLKPVALARHMKAVTQGSAPGSRQSSRISSGAPRCTICGHPALYLQGAHRFCRADLPRRQPSPEAEATP